MSKKMKNDEKAKEILAGHKRVGKIFIPPMKQLPKIQEVSYVHQLLPEIIWIGLINDIVGYGRGAEIVAQVAKIAKRIKHSEQFDNFALCRSYSTLTSGQKTKINEELEQLGLLRHLQELLAPLIQLYEDFPMAFLGKTGVEMAKKDLIGRIKMTIANHLDKYSTSGMTIQATTIYIRGIMGGLHFSKEMRVPNLDAIIIDPESEDAKHAAGFVRASVISEIMPPAVDGESGWAISFWNQGLKIDTCDFGAKEDDD